MASLKFQAAIRSAPKNQGFQWQDEKERIKIVDEMNEANSIDGGTPTLFSAAAQASLFDGKLTLFKIVALPAGAGVKYPKCVGIIATSEDGEMYTTTHFNISDTLFDKLKSVIPPSVFEKILTVCYTKQHYDDVMKEVKETSISQYQHFATLKAGVAKFSTPPSKDGEKPVRYICLDNWTYSS